MTLPEDADNLGSFKKYEAYHVLYMLTYLVYIRLILACICTALTIFSKRHKASCSRICIIRTVVAKLTQTVGIHRSTLNRGMKLNLHLSFFALFLLGATGLHFVLELLPLLLRMIQASYYAFGHYLSIATFKLPS
jgi:hypothetical protein